MEWRDQRGSKSSTELKLFIRSIRYQRHFNLEMFPSESSCTCKDVELLTKKKCFIFFVRLLQKFLLVIVDEKLIQSGVLSMVLYGCCDAAGVFPLAVAKSWIQPRGSRTRPQTTRRRHCVPTLILQQLTAAMNPQRVDEEDQRMANTCNRLTFASPFAYSILLL